MQSLWHPLPTHLFSEQKKSLREFAGPKVCFFALDMGNKRSFWDTFWTLAQNSEVGISSRKINFYELNYSIASNWILVWGKNEEGWPSKKGCFLINLLPCSTDDLAGFFHGASSPNEHPTNFDVPNKICFFLQTHRWGQATHFSLLQLLTAFILNFLSRHVLL